jgi:hypothetical protein
MYIYLDDRNHYESIYDRHTIETARRNIVYYHNFYKDLEKKLTKDDKIDRPGNALLLNAFYMQAVGGELIQRYNDREATIEKWMARDMAKDDQISSARITKEPYCQHCKKTGLRITDKSLMHRRENHNIDDPEDVLFMLRCPHCYKNSACWEDGTAWKPKPTLCSKCNTEMKHKTAKTKKAITFSYTCPSCKYSYNDKIDLADKKEEEHDPDYETDRIQYCLLDEEFRNHLFEIKHGFEGLAKLGKEMKEKEDNKHIYDAVNEMKKPKIAELVPLLAPVLEKAGYIDLILDKPEMGRDVYVGFSCLDNKSDRDDYDSRKTLKKLVDSALINTNWRLMSDGISYRLGYLNGRVKAFEGEEALKELVIKRGKLTPKQTSISATPKDNEKSMITPDGREIIY